MDCGWGTFLESTEHLLNSSEDHHLSMSVCVYRDTSLSCIFKDGIEFVTSYSHLILSPGNVLINVDEFITVKPNDIYSVIHALPIA